MNTTSLVKKWINGTYNNYGFVVKDDTSTGTVQWTTFYSSDKASPHKPELHIVYDIRQLEYWEANTDIIYRWFVTPSVSKYKLNENSNFYFDTAVTHGISQWSDAGLPIVYSGSASAKIKVYGGTLEEIGDERIFGFDLPDDTMGYADLDDSVFNNKIYDHIYDTIYEFKLNSVTAAIIDTSGFTMNNYKNVGAHELGHALGWCGHTFKVSNVMYAYGPSSITQLTELDKRHLTQFLQ